MRRRTPVHGFRSPWGYKTAVGRASSSILSFLNLHKHFGLSGGILFNFHSHLTFSLTLIPFFWLAGLPLATPSQFPSKAFKFLEKVFRIVKSGDYYEHNQSIEIIGLFQWIDISFSDGCIIKGSHLHPLNRPYWPEIVDLLQSNWHHWFIWTEKSDFVFYRWAILHLMAWVYHHVLTVHRIVKDPPSNTYVHLLGDPEKGSPRVASSHLIEVYVVLHTRMDWLSWRSVENDPLTQRGDFCLVFSMPLTHSLFWSQVFFFPLPFSSRKFIRMIKMLEALEKSWFPRWDLGVAFVPTKFRIRCLGLMNIIAFDSPEKEIVSSKWTNK